MPPTNLRLVQRFTSTAKTIFALIGVGTTARLIYEWRTNKALETSASPTNGSSQKRRVLCIPFHRMKIVEHKKTNALFDSLQSLTSLQSSDGIQEISLGDLIHTIHEAATDPEIVALYGTLGQGFKFKCGGYAHIEEIRDAIRVFNESHRIHDDKRLYTSRSQKYSFVFADTMDNPIDPGNKEYFLASAFSYIILQPRGILSLFGITTTTPFLRGFLDKYGIKVQ